MSDDNMDISKKIKDDTEDAIFYSALKSGSVYEYGKNEIMNVARLIPSRKDKTKPSIVILIGKMKAPHNKEQGLIKPEEIVHGTTLVFYSLKDVLFFKKALDVAYNFFTEYETSKDIIDNVEERDETNKE